MEITILDNKENKLLHRHEWRATVFFEDAVPSRKVLVEELSKKLKSKPELTVLEKVDTGYGETRAKLKGRSYEDAEKMKKVETPGMIKRHEFKADEPEQPAESEESPKEEAGKQETQEKAEESPKEKAETPEAEKADEKKEE